MSEQHPDRRVEHLKERLSEELVDADGRPADREAVSRAVESAAEPLVDAPVQEFAPLIIEHDARDALREEGLHRQLDDDEADTRPRPGQTASSTPDSDPIAVASQRGLATSGSGIDDRGLDDVDSEDVDSDV